jgi:hypothetical protein
VAEQTETCVCGKTRDGHYFGSPDSSTAWCYNVYDDKRSFTPAPAPASTTPPAAQGESQIPDWLRRDYKNALLDCTELKLRLRAAEARVSELEGALRWALGEGDEFRLRGPGEGAFWWRKELGERAALSRPAQNGEDTQK